MLGTKLRLLSIIGVGALFPSCTTIGLVRSAGAQIPTVQSPAASSSAPQPAAASAKSTTPTATSTSVAERTPEHLITGSVVTSRGEPMAGASVVLYLEYLGDAGPDTLSTITDGRGQFRLTVTSLGPRGRGYNGNQSHLFAYRLGSALAVGLPRDEAHRYVLPDAAPRSVAVQAADGKSLAGVKVMPRAVHVSGGSSVEIPVSLSARLAATTGPDGKATLTSMAANDGLIALRVSGPSLAGQDIVLEDRTDAAPLLGTATVKLQAGGQLGGRIVDEHGQGVAGQVVEVWARGGFFVHPSPVEFAGGPVRTSTDGSFRTPPGLLAGSKYRVVVRATAKDLIVGNWITLDEKDHESPVIVQQTLRTHRGRVVDRAGKPIKDAEVLQRGDGPEWTSTRTDADGRFSLGGFRPGAVIVFVRREGFRFQGQLVKPTDGEIAITLTHRNEPPLREMKPLRNPEMPADSQAIARRLIEPLLQPTLQRKDRQFAQYVFSSLAAVDPAAALERLDQAKLLGAQGEMRVRLALIEHLARSDPEEAASLAEAIPEAGVAASTLLLIAKAQPPTRRALKMDLLDRVLLRAKAGNSVRERLNYAAKVANVWCDIGEVEKARKLIAETLPIANQYTRKTDIDRGFFAASLARFDLPAAMAMANEFKDTLSRHRVLGVMAIQLAATNPAEAERLWDEAGPFSRPYKECLEACWRLAASDPVRARRIAARMAAERGDVNYYAVLALGLAPHDWAAARAALHQGLDEVDQLMNDPQTDYIVRGFLELALELVDRIDPTYTAEILWRLLSTRRSLYDPKLPYGWSWGRMITYVAMFDRDLARSLLVTTTARRTRVEDGGIAESLLDIISRMAIDPTGAIVAVEKLPISADPYNLSSTLRIEVATALTRADYWRFKLNAGSLDFLPQP